MKLLIAASRVKRGKLVLERVLARVLPSVLARVPIMFRPKRINLHPIVF